MSQKFFRVSNFTFVSALIITLCGSIGSGAAAQIIQATPSIDVFTSPENMSPKVEATDVATQAASLEDLIAQQQPVSDVTPELKCLAGAIYFESRSQSPEGQLAVGRVIVARTKSGRFPTSYCGVVLQPSQFSFVRHHTIPQVDSDSAQWHESVAVAKIAMAGSWQSPAEGALYFHAKRAAPGWHRHRVAEIENHIFYQ
jgi:spore germination cell wall hydrolase CwlJ-like protein